MCGIMGYIGPDAAWEIVMEACAASSTAATTRRAWSPSTRRRLALARKVGPLRVLEQAFPRGLPGHVAIGHTRWATHGGVSEANCHPHLDSRGRVAIVHNGVIDNVDALRSELVADGVTFRSETDSEVLAELIGRRSRQAARCATQ